MKSVKKTAYKCEENGISARVELQKIVTRMEKQ